METTQSILAIDLGTSRVKVALIGESLETVASTSESYPTLTAEPDQAEQRVDDWLAAIRTATARLTAEHSSVSILAVTLTAQMPTLVALDSDRKVIGNAITWQDSRADSLVDELLTTEQKLTISQVAGTPIDGRYIIPMHLLRLSSKDYKPTLLLSAKDYLFYILTGEFVTDPSTASGFGNYDLVGETWNPNLTSLWDISISLLPEIRSSDYSLPLIETGTALVPGLITGTPVYLGAADSVCAHHFVERHFTKAISIIDGSSTVIMASSVPGHNFQGQVLRSPLVDASQSGIEMDLLASGSSIAWLAGLLALSPSELEELALAHADMANAATRLYPYLAGGEQGALWRTDLLGSIQAISLSTSRNDLALAVFEGIAFETLRCLRLLQNPSTPRTVVALTGRNSRGLGPAILSALLGSPVIAIGQQSPSLLGAALIALDGLGLGHKISGSAIGSDSLPNLDLHYVKGLAEKAERYFQNSPA
jgi:xylulokinase